MDNLDNFDSYEGPETQSSPEGTKEASREQSEKQREKASKTLAGIGRTRKDEGKGKKHAALLAKVITYLVEHNYNSEVLPLVLDLLERGIPPNVIIGLSILVDKNILNFVLNDLAYVNTFPKLIPRSMPTIFHADILNEAEKKYINLWIETLSTLLVENTSTILMQRFMKQIKGDTRDCIVNSIEKVMSLFFASLSITTERSLFSYAEFILERMEKKIGQTQFEDVDTGERIKL